MVLQVLDNSSGCIGRIPAPHKIRIQLLFAFVRVWFSGEAALPFVGEDERVLEEHVLIGMLFQGGINLLRRNTPLAEVGPEPKRPVPYMFHAVLDEPGRKRGVVKVSDVVESVDDVVDDIFRKFAASQFLAHLVLRPTAVAKIRNRGRFRPDSSIGKHDGIDVFSR